MVSSASYSLLRVADSMITQHFKWLRKAAGHKWRKQYPSLNWLRLQLFSNKTAQWLYQDPGLLTHLSEKTRIHSGILASKCQLFDGGYGRSFESEERINLIVSSKHPRPQFYSAEEASIGCEGLKIIDWASTDGDNEPDLVIASGYGTKFGSISGCFIVKQEFPEMKIRLSMWWTCWNCVIRLRTLGPTDEEFDAYSPPTNQSSLLSMAMKA